MLIVVPDEEKNQGETEQSESLLDSKKKVGRNEKCPCGSGKKFKHCHGNI